MSREFDFYIVPTPIGNIKDITLRAIEVLKSVDLIACEDTRTTQNLLNFHNITTKCISYHKFNEKERVNFILNEIRNGKKIALVSDAGTPTICDPGGVIIEALKENGFSYTSLPGASAVTTFLSMLPRSGEEFTFIGFIPRGEGQIKEISKKYADKNFVFYDSPNRILDSLEVIKQARGDIEISLGRELSKLYEEVVTDRISNILEHFKNGIKGEIVCMVYADKNSDETKLDYMIKDLNKKGYSNSDISTILSTLFDLNKNKIYKRTLEITKTV